MPWVRSPAGLVRAAIEANAVFFTGGTDAGVIKLIGEVFERCNVEAPIVAPSVSSFPARALAISAWALTRSAWSAF